MSTEELAGWDAVETAERIRRRDVSHREVVEDFLWYWSFLAWMQVRTARLTLHWRFDTSKIEPLTAGLARRFSRNVGSFWTAGQVQQGAPHRRPVRRSARRRPDAPRAGTVDRDGAPMGDGTFREPRARTLAPMNIVVLDSFAADQGHLDWDALSTYGTLSVYPRTAPDEIVERAAAADALLTNKVVLDAAVIGALPRLRYVGIVATGTNAVDLSACRQRGIAVTNVPGYSTRSVAQLVIAFVLHFTSGVARHDQAVKAGAWARSPDFSFCVQPLVELSDKTLCIVGLGAIGRAVADVARALGMRVVAAAVPGSTSNGRTPLESALPESDFVTLHCPLTRATTHLVSTEFIGRMKPGAVLINTGRGGLVDERALMHALRDGRLGGAALDVLEAEPPPADHPLLQPDAPWASRLVVTPHVGWATVEARRRLITAVADNLGAFCRGELDNRVDVSAGR